MKIRFDHAATVRLTFAAGDVLIVKEPSAELDAILANARLDGAKVAVIVPDEDEVADAEVTRREKAITGKGRTRVERPTAVS